MHVYPHSTIIIVLYYRSYQCACLPNELAQHDHIFYTRPSNAISVHCRYIFFVITILRLHCALYAVLLRRHGTKDTVDANAVISYGFNTNVHNANIVYDSNLVG